VANKYSVTSVSFSGQEDLLAKAKARAKSLNLKLSKYVCVLLERDLKKGGDLILSERGPDYKCEPPPSPPNRDK
jgi:hypothetical protein